MRDRAESGRGRPWSEPSLEAVQKLESRMQRDRVERRYDFVEMIWRCPFTGENLYVEFPLSLYNPHQAEVEMLKRDTDHNHKAWETFRLL